MTIHKGRHATILSSLDALLEHPRSTHRTGKGRVRPRPKKDHDAGLEPFPNESSTPDSSWFSVNFCAKMHSILVQT
jgi:hypothetical protein